MNADLVKPVISVGLAVSLNAGQPVGPDLSPTTDPMADWHGPVRFRTPAVATRPTKTAGRILVVDAPSGLAALWGPEPPAMPGGLAPVQDEQMSRVLRLTRAGLTLEQPEETPVYDRLSGNDPAERAYLMSRFRSLPAPGVPAVFAVGLIGMGVRRR